MNFYNADFKRKNVGNPSKTPTDEIRIRLIVNELIPSSELAKAKVI